MRILVAEHDVLIARGIALALKAAGFVSDHTDLGDEALEMAQQFEYDVVLLDSALPGMDGLTVLREMRNARRNAPIVILAADPTAKFKTAALQAGADDVMATPVDPDELVAWVHAIAQQSRGLGDSSIQIGSLAINLSNQQVTCQGEPLKLTGKEFGMLELLVLRKGTVLTRDAFMNHLYGGMDEPESKIVDIFICKLRKKLQAVGINDLIINVWGRGYMLRDGRSLPAQVPGLRAPASVQAPQFAL